jgi:hypothetical protein
MQSITIATRRYVDYCPRTNTETQLVDRMVRKGGKFFLIEEPEKAGGLEVVKSYSLERVFEWLQECPWQIERTVIVNEAASRCPQT